MENNRPVRKNYSLGAVEAGKLQAPHGKLQATRHGPDSANYRPFPYETVICREIAD
jgi:hypothetical protein